MEEPDTCIKLSRSDRKACGILFSIGKDSKDRHAKICSRAAPENAFDSELRRQQ